MNHYACYIDAQGRERQMALPAPAGNYGIGHLVSAASGKYKLTGAPHHQPTKSNPSVCEAFWPAEPITAIDPLLTREKD